MNIGIIGDGAIGGYVREAALGRGHQLSALLLRPELTANRSTVHGGPALVSTVADLPPDIDLMIDCAGHSALEHYGPGILRRGTDLMTVSIGALANDELFADLRRAAADGGATLRLASGAIGALDALRAARTGSVQRVSYIGTKPPEGWRGSPAEHKLDLDGLTAAAVHFDGSARDAAAAYPKNANVAAAVALAGVGFEDTRVRLIADPAAEDNVHEVEAIGDFGQFTFEIRGKTLPDNPRSSALAAMSVVAQLEQASRNVQF